MINIFSVNNPKRAFTHIVILLGACVMLAACLIAFYQQQSSHTAHLQEGKENTTRLTNALAGYIELTFLSVDLTLRRASDNAKAEPDDSIDSNFKSWVNDTSSISGMLVTDNKGVVQHAFYKDSEKPQLFQEGMSLKDQRYFIRHKMNEKDEIHISPASMAPDEKNNYIVISRPIITENGSFGGIIAAFIDVEYLTSMLHSVEPDRNMKMALVLDEGMVLAQVSTENTSDFNTARFVASLINGTTNQPGSLSIMEEEIDHVKHLITLKHLNQLPITVSLLATEESILKNWRISRNNTILFLGILALFISVISFLALIISKQMQQIRKSEKMALLSNQNTSKFITKMNYELRTPLNTIIGFSEMIHLGYFGALNEKQKERVYDIYICGTYLLEFVHDILDIIREEEGKLVLSEVKIKVLPIIETVFRTVLPYAKKEGVNILCEEGIESLPELKADERKLRQALLNLVTNMVKYTPSGGMVSLSGEIDAKGNMIINVLSKGITLSPEDFSMAFSMTGQINSSDNEGGGLGLPLCKIFIERHGGQIKLHNNDGEGITVRVILPAERVL